MTASLDEPLAGTSPPRSGRVRQNRPDGRRAALGILFGLIGVVIFGGTLPATKLAVAAFEPAFITAGRAAIAGCLAAFTLAILGQSLPPRRDWPVIGLSSLLLVGGFPLFMSLGLMTADAAHGGIVLAVLPLATAVAASLVTEERPSRAFWFWTILGCGVVFLFVLQRSNGAPGPADALFGLAALSAAFGYALSGKLSRSRPGWEVICWQLVIAMPVTVSLTLLLWLDSPSRPVPLSAIAGLAYTALFSMFLGFFAWNAGLALGGVAKVGQLQLFQVFVTLVLSQLVLGEHMDASTWVFAGLVGIIVGLGQRARVGTTAAKPGGLA